MIIKVPQLTFILILSKISSKISIVKKMYLTKTWVDLNFTLQVRENHSLSREHF